MQRLNTFLSGDFIFSPLPVIGKRLAFFSDPWGNLIELAEVLR